MPYLKKDRVGFTNEAGVKEIIDLKIHVNAKGEFYAVIPDWLEVSSREPSVAFCYLQRGRHNRRSVFADNPADPLKAFAKTPDELVSKVGRALQLYMEVQRKEEFVIHYNMESHVCFAEDEAGEIYPSAVYEGAEWIAINDERYGNHHASQRCEGGYSLTVGAKALVKTTLTYGEAVKYEYREYNGNGSHLDHVCPASRLNSWVAMELPKNCKEIPYTDQAAEFFYGIMYGMAKLSRQIQEYASDPEKMIELIESNQTLLPGT